MKGFFDIEEIKGHYEIQLIDEHFNLVGQMKFDPVIDSKQEIFDTTKSVRLIRVDWVPDE